MFYQCATQPADSLHIKLQLMDKLAATSWHKGNHNPSFRRLVGTITLLVVKEEKGDQTLGNKL